MTIQEILNKDIWERFLSQQTGKTFLQSWNWGEFHKQMGNTVWRLGVFEQEKLRAVALVVKVQAKRGTFLMAQHLVPMGQEYFEALFAEIKRIGKQEEASFLRLAPLWERTKENQEYFQKMGFREAPTHVNAYEATWKLDIQADEEALFKAMRKTTRYLIRQTLKNEDIRVEKSDRIEDIERFEKLNKLVAQRQGFVPFSYAFVKREFDMFSKDGNVLWLFGKYRNEDVSASLLIFWDGVGFYHQAASSGKYQKLSIPYRVQWEAIKEAKKRGCRLYDFWGFTDPIKYPKHPWAGPSLFKMGFGGQAHEYVKTQDYILSSKYWLTYFFEIIRKIKRGL